MRSATQKGKSGKKSLAQFARDKRREGCPVCALEVAVRGQLAEASARKIPRATQLEWLKTELGVKISDADLTRHNGGRHDTP